MKVTRVRLPRRRARCPYCGSRDTLPIVYGLIAEPVRRVVVGGCVIFDGQPLRHCNRCGRGFEFRNMSSAPEDHDDR